MKNVLRSRFFIVCCFVFLFSGAPAFASEIKNSGFQVHSVLPSEQLDEKVSYYHVPLQPGETKSFEFVLSNFSNTEKIIAVERLNALSSPLVNIDYHPETASFYSGFLDPVFALKDSIVVPETITLAPQEKKTVSFQVKMPDTFDEGELLGGISFVEKKDIKGGNNGKNEMTVEIKQKFTIAILLDSGVKPKVDLSIPSVSVDVTTGDPLLYSVIENHTPAIVSDYVLHYSVFPKEQDTVLFEDSLPLKTFSPKTTMKQPINWGQNSLQPGDYTIEFALVNKGGVFTYSNQQDFSIEQNDIDELVEAAEKAQKENVIVAPSKPWWIWLLVSIVLFFLLYNGKQFIQKRKKQSSE